MGSFQRCSSQSCASFNVLPIYSPDTATNYPIQPEDDDKGGVVGNMKTKKSKYDQLHFLQSASACHAVKLAEEWVRLKWNIWKPLLAGHGRAALFSCVWSQVFASKSRKQGKPDSRPDSMWTGLHFISLVEKLICSAVYICDARPCTVKTAVLSLFPFFSSVSK